MTTTIWLSPLDPHCQLCSLPFNGVMFDARIGNGPWGNICQKCFDSNGCRLGTGWGQRYELQDYDFGSAEASNITKAWVCVEGDNSVRP